MRTFILLGLTASSALAALSSAGQPIKRAALQNRELGAASFDSLFVRQTLECPVATTTCTDGLGCCQLTETCCLDGCCPFQYSCDPDGEGTASQPCVCFGFGCPDPVDDDDEDSSSTSTTTRSSMTSMTSETTTAAAAVPTTTTEEDDEDTTTTSAATASDSSAQDSGAATTSTDMVASGTDAASTETPTESAAGGGSAGGDTGAGAQVSGMGVAAFMLLAGSIGIAAVAM